jgi:hypothetical protein
VRVLLVRAVWVLLICAVQNSTAVAQDHDPLVRLDPTVRHAVAVMLDSARQAGLPTAPIESKVFEGLSKKVHSRRILAAARNVYESLRLARAALGKDASTDELTAGAGALRVGVTTAELANLARGQREKLLTVPLVVLADLVTRGVPRDTASQTIFQLWQRGAGDDDFYGLWRGVERDIVSGTAPGVALLARAREIPSRVPPQGTPPASGTRPE